MAKRFTDTAKWDKAWFRTLSPRLKCAWEFLRDRCNCAGIWEIDMDAMRFYVGEPVELSELTEKFDVLLVDGGSKMFIRNFIEFQYGKKLNASCNAHKPVIEAIIKYSLEVPFLNPSGRVNELLPESSPTLLDKDKDKDQDLDQDQDKEGQPFSPITNDPLLAVDLKEIPLHGQQAWINAYGPDLEWIEARLIEALAQWKTAGSKVHNDSLARFLNRWLQNNKKPKKTGPRVVFDKTMDEYEAEVAGG